jgi:insulysin
LDYETNRLWAYIGGEYLNFSQVDQDVASIRQLTKDDVKEFFGQYIDPESPNRAKLSIHLEAQASSTPPPETSSAEQKEQATGLIGQILSSLGVELEEIKLKQSFEKVDLTDVQGIVHATEEYIGSSLSAEKTKEILAQMKEAVPQLQMALKIKPAEATTNGAGMAAQTSTPVVIKDVHQWKAGLQVSKGPVAVVDIRQFEDLESKL